jgi:hypothetical protein
MSGNREFFLVTTILIVFSLLCPPIAFLTGLLAIFVIAGWLVHDVHGFLSVVWRILLILILLASSVIVISYLTTPLASYRNQYLIAGIIGFALATGGLVRSLLNAPKGT